MWGPTTHNLQPTCDAIAQSPNDPMLSLARINRKIEAEICPYGNLRDAEGLQSMTNVQRPPLEKIFGPQGWLARHHPQYEYRQAQLEMAEEVETALKNRRHLIAEAGTGTGKTLAYLVPIVLSGRRVVISTGTRNLQEQVFFKDIPFLKKLFPEIRATLMKGRQNYLCRQKLYDIEQQPVLSGLEETELYVRLREWERKTETGDRAEVEGLRDSSELWAKVDA